MGARPWLGRAALSRVGVAMEMITHTFQQTFTFAWLALALPIAFGLSLLVNRILAAAAFSVIGVALLHVGPILWPMFEQNAARETMMQAATGVLQKLDP